MFSEEVWGPKVFSGAEVRVLCKTHTMSLWSLL